MGSLLITSADSANELDDFLGDMIARSSLITKNVSIDGD